MDLDPVGEGCFGFGSPPCGRSKMRKTTNQIPIKCLLISFILHLIGSCGADIGTATSYSAPYMPTDCYGNDPGQFPSNNLFAAAGDGIWDNGASCGRQYLVRCISAPAPYACVSDRAILIKIVDRAGMKAPSAITVLLSDTAFRAITNSTSTTVNIDFRQM